MVGFLWRGVWGVSGLFLEAGTLRGLRWLQRGRLAIISW